MIDSNEQAVISFIKEKLSGTKEPVIFDCGAAHGFFTLEITKDLSGSKVFVIEPVKKNFDILEGLFKDNKKVTLIKAGVSDRVGSEPIFVAECNGSCDGSSFVNRGIFRHEMFKMSSENSEVTTVDAICEKYEVEEISILKLDVEGYEMKALQGAKKMLKDGKIKFIMIEYGTTFKDANITLAALMNYMSELGYKCYDVVKTGLPEHWHGGNFNENYDYNNYIFTNIEL